MKNKFCIYDQNNNVIAIINPVMAKDKGLDDTHIQAINTSHQIKHFLFDLARKSENETEIEMLASLVESLEFLQQKIWGFVPDRSHHRFFDFPGCTCPKIDNEDRLGGGERVYNPECPVHKNALDEMSSVEE